MLQAVTCGHWSGPSARAVSSPSAIAKVRLRLFTDDQESQYHWLWLTQGGMTRPIHSLALSGQDLGNSRSIKGVIQVLKSDASTGEALRIELRRKKNSHLTIPKGVAWK